MTRLDRVLRDSLGHSASEYRPRHSSEARVEVLRRIRRRRLGVAAGATAAGAAAVAVVAVLATTIPEREDSNVAGPRRANVSAVVEVGGNPTGVAESEGRVWVADGTDGTLSEIDPERDRVVSRIEVGGNPGEIDAGGRFVWVADSRNGTVTLVDARTGTVSGDPVRIPGAAGGPLSIEAGRFAAWVVSPRAGIFDVPLDSSRAIPIAGAERPVDIELEQNDIWVLDAGGGELIRLDGASGTIVNRILAPPGAAGGVVLESTPGGVWMGAGRTLTRVDFTGTVTARASLPGRVLAAADSSHELVVLVAGEAGRLLVTLDPGSGRRIGPPQLLRGAPVGLDVRPEGPIWVLDPGSAAVSRIERSSPNAPERPLDDDTVVYAFARDGDIFAAEADGGVRVLVGTEAEESHPAFLDDGTISYERDGPGGTELHTVDPSSGAEEASSTGSSLVTFGPSGRVAALLDSDGGQARIGVGESLDSLEPVFVANPAFQPLTVANIAWDDSGDRLYYEAGFRLRSLYTIGVRTTEGRPSGISVTSPRRVSGSEPGSDLLGPIPAGPNRMMAIQICCRPTGSLRSAELGELAGASGPTTFTRMVGLAEFGFDPTTQVVVVANAGRLDVEGGPGGTVSWTEGEARSWIVGDGRALWLVDDEGEADRLSPIGVQGVAVNQALTGEG